MPSAVINASASGDNTIVAAQGAGTAIRVWGFSLVATSAVNASLKSNATVKFGPASFAANGGISRTGGGEPVFTCGINEPLILNLSSGVQVGGDVSYTVIGTNS